MTTRIAMNKTPRGLLEGMIKTETYLKHSGIDLKLIELIKYRVSQINGCGYCLDMHHQEARRLGETELRLHTVAAWQECPYFNGQEKASLHFAEVLTLTHSQPVPDGLYKQLLQFYTEDEIACLTVAVTQINSWNRINKLFGTMPGTYQAQPVAITQNNEETL